MVIISTALFMDTDEHFLLASGRMGARRIFTLLAGTFALFIPVVFLLVFLKVPSNPVGPGWFLFSFATGLSTVVLPSVLPLAFVIVPLAMGKGVTKGIIITLCFSIGMIFMLGIYGAAIALVGGMLIDVTGLPANDLAHWLYLIGGASAFIFALSEVGLLHMPTPTFDRGAPRFIERQHPFIKSLLLGLFLGNIWIAFSHPALPLLVGQIISSHNALYGFIILVVHAIGRVIPLFVLGITGILGVNGLEWIVARKDRIERGIGWFTLFAAALVVVIGLSYKISGTQSAFIFTFLCTVPLWWFYYAAWKRVKMQRDGFEKENAVKMLNVQRGMFTIVSVLVLIASFFIVPIFHVDGGEENKNINFATKQTIVGTNNTYVIYFEHAPEIIAGQATMLTFEFRDDHDKAVELDPYLESKMYLSILNGDLSFFVHVDSADSGSMEHDQTLHSPYISVENVESDSCDEICQACEKGSSACPYDYYESSCDEGPYDPNCYKSECEFGGLYPCSQSNGKICIGDGDCYTPDPNSCDEGGCYTDNGFYCENGGTCYIPDSGCAEGGPDPYCGEYNDEGGACAEYPDECDAENAIEVNEQHYIDAEKNVIMFHVTFPKPGVYKLFGQFRPKNEDLAEDDYLLTTFYIKVK
ncbi:hypothetical protein KW783_01105 [Candidatus Parcubacteria bacterium]|nr:hypothetical protein [Candidatus Parcubacteria bacterium]